MPKRDEYGLTKQQRGFADDYLADPQQNATGAYRNHYKAKNDNTAAASASKLLRNGKVAAYIQMRMDARAEKTGITQEKVLEEIARFAFFDPRTLFDEQGVLLPPSQWSDEAARAIESVDVREEYVGTGDDRAFIGYTRKLRLVSKAKGLEMLGRHLKLFTDKLDLGVNDDLADLIARAQKRAGIKS